MPSLDLGSVVGPQGEQGATGAQGIRGEQGLPGPNQVTNSTATPLTGVLTGNGSVVGVASIDAAPTEDSTGFAQSGGTDKAIKARMPVYGMGKNLLDNWYFVGGGSQQGGGQLPINQRGQTSYSIGYSIDRWVVNTGSTLTFASDGVHISADGTYKQFYQLLENPAALANRTLTLSMLITSASVLPYAIVYKDSTTEIFRERIESPDLYVKTFTTDSDGVASVRLNGLSYVADYTIQAMKLEIGTEQTLAHNEGTAESPVWVINDVPDYEYELYRCMTSTADSSDTYANKTLATEQQLAPIEWGTTASVRHEVGSCFCWNGLLYRTTVAIDANNPITPGTNCVQSSASAGLLKQKPFSGTTSSNYGGITDILPSGAGDIVSIRITKVGTSSGLNAYAIPFVGTDGKLSSALFYSVVTGSLKSTAIEGIAYYV